MNENELEKVVELSRASLTRIHGMWRWSLLVMWFILLCAFAAILNTGYALMHTQWWVTPDPLMQLTQMEMIYEMRFYVGLVAAPILFGIGFLFILSSRYLGHLYTGGCEGLRMQERALDMMGGVETAEVVFQEPPEN